MEIKIEINRKTLERLEFRATSTGRTLEEVIQNQLIKNIEHEYDKSDWRFKRRVFLNRVTYLNDCLSDYQDRNIQLERILIEGLQDKNK